MKQVYDTNLQQRIQESLSEGDRRKLEQLGLMNER